GGSADSAVVTGLPAGVTASVDVNAKTVTISGAPEDATTGITYTITTTGHTAPCVAAEITGTITVNDSSIIDFTSGVQNPVVCLGENIPSAIYTYGGNADSAIVSGLPAGVTATVNIGAKTVTISGAPTSATLGTVYTITTPGHTAPCVAAEITGT